jgi:anaerobic nitric oxide reductase transcription regulator
VRELENVLYRSVLQAASGVPRGEAVVVGLAHLGPEFGGETARAPAPEAEAPLPARPRSLRDEVDDFERRLVRRVVDANSGNWAAAARDLGLHRANLHRLARRLGITEPAPRGRR